MRLVCELAGYALVAVGLGLAWLPLGVIAAGVALVIVGNSEAA